MGSSRRARAGDGEDLLRKSIVILSIAAPIVVVLEAGFMAYWASGRGAVGLDLRVPDRDDEPTPGSAPFAAPRNTGKLMPGQASPSDLPGLWPQFRGPGRTAVAPPAEKLPARLPEKLPVLWKIEVGEGHAGVAVRNGRVYIHDYDRERSEDAIRCLSHPHPPHNTPNTNNHNPPPTSESGRRSPSPYHSHRRDGSS